MGSGTFGDTYLVEDQKGNLFALKKIPTNILDENSIQRANIIAFGEWMKNIKSDHVVKLESFSKDDDYIEVVTEYCNGGNLLNEQVKQ